MRRLLILLLASLLMVPARAQNAKDFKFNAFKRIVIDFPAKVLISYSPDYSIRVVDSSQSKTVVLFFDKMDKTQKRSSISMDKFKITEKDSTLYISSYDQLPTNVIKVSIIIHMPKLEKITVETAASINITGAFNLDHLAMEIEGASSIKILGEPKIKHLSVKDEGASYILLDLDNPIGMADFDIEGACYVSAIETPIKQVSAKVEGASILKVYPLDAFNVKVEGMSFVVYKGKPKKTHVSSEGLSIVKHVD